MCLCVCFLYLDKTKDKSSRLNLTYFILNERTSFFTVLMPHARVAMESWTLFSSLFSRALNTTRCPSSIITIICHTDGLIFHNSARSDQIAPRWPSTKVWKQFLFTVIFLRSTGVGHSNVPKLKLAPHPDKSQRRPQCEATHGSLSVAHCYELFMVSLGAWIPRDRGQLRRVRSWAESELKSVRLAVEHETCGAFVSPFKIEQTSNDKMRAVIARAQFKKTQKVPNHPFLYLIRTLRFSSAVFQHFLNPSLKQKCNLTSNFIKKHF